MAAYDFKEIQTVKSECCKLDAIIHDSKGYMLCKAILLKCYL